MQTQLSQLQGVKTAHQLSPVGAENLHEKKMEVGGRKKEREKENCK